MAKSPFLLEIRTGGELKAKLRDLIYDVADEFNVYGAARPRAVPHVTLFGPYNTDKGQEVKRTTQLVLDRYDVVPYRIDGFDAFPEKNVIYADVVPSEELRELRRDLAAELAPLTYNRRSWDKQFYYDFHTTIAFKDIGRKFDAIREYVLEQYEPEFDEYATRISSLRRSDMMWEWDVPRGVELRPDEATSAESWEKTMAALRDFQSEADHKGVASNPTGIHRSLSEGFAKLLGWAATRRNVQ